MKQVEIKNLSVADLQERLKEIKKAHADLKKAHALSPIGNPLQIRSARRTVARLMTELTKRELQ